MLSLRWQKSLLLLPMEVVPEVTLIPRHVALVPIDISLDPPGIRHFFVSFPGLAATISSVRLPLFPIAFYAVLLDIPLVLADVLFVVSNIGTLSPARRA